MAGGRRHALRGGGAGAEARLNRTAGSLAVLAAFAAVALARHDLVEQAWTATRLSLDAGGPWRWRVMGEAALLAAILAACWKTVSEDFRPGRDLKIAALAALAGWAAEAWGTRTGYWGYYTAERPPLWIVPAWPFGALVVRRLAERAAKAWPPPSRETYTAAAALAAAVCVCFIAPRLERPWAWLGLAGALAGLFWGARAERDFWPLVVGAACVFFADFWGTTNRCWAYYLHKSPGGLWAGIAFGMAFDTAVVLGCLRLALLIKF